MNKGHCCVTSWGINRMAVLIILTAVVSKSTSDVIHIITAFVTEYIYSVILSKFFITDDYAKDGGLGEVRLLCSFYMSLCALESKQTLISLIFQIIRVRNMRSYLRLICEYEL